MMNLKEVYEKTGLGVCLIGETTVECYMVPNEIKPLIYEVKDKILMRLKDLEGGILEFEKLKVIVIRTNDHFLVFPVEGSAGTIYYNLRNLVRGLE